MVKERIIIDADIGDDIDDMMAIAYALRRPELEIVGITTVWGDVDTRARMAVQLLDLAGRRDIPVYAGCDETLCGSVKKRGHINQVVGDLTPYTYDKTRHAVDFIIDTVLASDGDITLVPIGALTNIAMALIKCPQIKTKLKQIVWMGGMFYSHFITWNAACDPDAVKVVFESGVPLYAVSRDVCERCLMTKEQTERLLQSKDPVNRLLAEEIRLFREYHKREPILYDPLTVTAVFDKSLLTFKQEHVLVETKGEYTRGLTLACRPHYDRFYMMPHFPRHEDIPVVNVACDVDVQGYIEHYLDCMLNMPVCPKQ